ncbi:MAG: cysteine desulfurase IscS [Anaerolineaceae bacterium]|nr:cysteine desulfurase [Anaerolineae bacterium]MBL1172132.1 cysteine desulfurase [Chloroflexota bacterium]MDL1926560.1 cysteine desulfurase [Anaerolineae bacterium AMX1]WKZ55878.1 MAG: cysteine desulfurase family protein [Anaerolineales bacterium]GJQ39878.1 MAG: cysteine desulfurase IscS [Anaerolineaceae bacterium]
MIYLDYAATTPVDARVLDAMTPYFADSFGNPSSVHRFGQRAEAAVESARETVASALHCRPDEIIFTSCGSESDNLALRGAMMFGLQNDRPWLLTSRAEHHAVSKTAEQLEKYYGVQVEWLPVDAHGIVTPETMRRAVCDGTALASVMLANNEIGTINPVAALASICRERGILFHTDAVQAAAYLDVDVTQLGVDMLSLGGHKFYGPKGVGALYVKKGTRLVPHTTGGGQEFGLRAGTQNVPYIVGFAEALRLTVQEREGRVAHVQPLRDQVIGRVLEEIPDARLTGHPENRLPNHASFVFKDADGNLLLQLLDAAGFACSSGSACKTGNPEPSEVIAALGLSRDWALGSLRITLGKDSTPEQINSFLNLLPSFVEKSRALR